MADPFTRCHPAVNFAFFVVAIVCNVVLLHPIYLAVSALCAALYYGALRGRKAVRTLLGFIPVFVALSVVNPIFNTLGEHVLFTYFNRPYTWEALCYGMMIAAMFVGVMLWFLCYGIVMTSDKFTNLFAPIMPALSLLLVMVLRLVPAYWRKAKQIDGARRSIGKSGTGTRKEKMSAAVTILSALSGWALEGSVITADSMRARGYGSAKRTSYRIYRFTVSDGVIAFVLALCLVLTIVAAALGHAEATFIPQIHIAPLSGALSIVGIASYAWMLLLPTLLRLREEILWHNLISNM